MKKIQMRILLFVLFYSNLFAINLALADKEKESDKKDQGKKSSSKKTSSEEKEPKTISIERAKHHKNEFAMGAILAGGYNVINHVDGILSSIPNKGDSTLSPTADGSTTFYSMPLSLDINVAMAMEYWFSSSWSLRSEIGIDLEVVGAWNATSNFAFLYMYLKASMGARYYFDKFNLGFLYVGAGAFGNFPISPVMLGFVPSPNINSANITGGPYAEFGINYPINRYLNLEAFIRFSFNIRNLSDKSNPNIYTDVNVSPLAIGFGLHYRIM